MEIEHRGEGGIKIVKRNGFKNLSGTHVSCGEHT
jgi:hypothetical protein